jgi:hypothetical protein
MDMVIQADGKFYRMVSSGGGAGGAGGPMEHLQMLEEWRNRIISNINYSEQHHNHSMDQLQEFMLEVEVVDLEQVEVQEDQEVVVEQYITRRNTRNN